MLKPRGTAFAAAGAFVLCAVGVALYRARISGTLLPAWFPGSLAILALVLVFGIGRHILAMALQALRRGILNQHVLLEIGAFAGIAGGAIGLVWQPEGYPTAAFFAVSVMVTTYHLFSEWLSLIVKTRSSQAVKKLLDLQPDTARVVRSGREAEIPIEQVKVGDLVRIRPGERVPVDGEVVSGRSAVDEALVTGEPLPVDKSSGGKVVGGSINGTGTLLVRVSTVGEGTFLQQVILQVEDARALKPGLLHLVDRVLRIYTPAVLALAALAVSGWVIVSWLAGGPVDIQRAVFAGLSVLVMGYPCAVGISAPLSIVRGVGEAAERGILMRTGEAFQGFRLVRRIAFDKTGTLTEGRPLLWGIVTAGTSENELLAIAAAAEASSEHPLAQAIVKAAFDRGITPGDTDEFAALPGRGVAAMLDGAEILVGNPDFLSSRGVSLAALAEQIARFEEEGATVIAVARDGEALGVLAFGDRLRPDAANTVAVLKKLGLQPVLLTGDNEPAARRIARAAGIEEVHARVPPQGKTDIIRALQKTNRVAMVGDGINDAPALMQANVGIAMGSGTDIAIESADIIILSPRLESVVAAYEISRRSYRKMVQNVLLAFCFNGIGIPLAATGFLYPVWAMAAMAASVTAIFFNSLWGKPSLFFDAVMSVGRPLSLT